MILAEPFRFCLPALSVGKIAINEDGQKFKIVISSSKFVKLEPYEGKKNHDVVVFMGVLPTESE